MPYIRLLSIDANLSSQLLSAATNCGPLSLKQGSDNFVGESKAI